jgi:hypothetical protein
MLTNNIIIGFLFFLVIIVGSLIWVYNFPKSNNPSVYKSLNFTDEMTQTQNNSTVAKSAEVATTTAESNSASVSTAEVATTTEAKAATSAAVVAKVTAARTFDANTSVITAANNASTAAAAALAAHTAVITAASNAATAAALAVVTASNAAKTAKAAAVKAAAYSALTTEDINASKAAVTYVGCYGDGPTRAISGGATQPVPLFEGCIERARSLGHTMMGLQSGQCFTGNDLYLAKVMYGTKQFDELSPAICNIKDPDNNLMGGPWANSIYILN